MIYFTRKFASIPLLLILFFALGCSSTKNQFEKGNYEKAVELAINKLRKKPNNEKQKAILKTAYQLAVQVGEEKIKQAENQNNAFKWDGVIGQYQRLQKIYLALLQCPACLNEVTPVDYQSPLNEAYQKGANAYVLAGNELLDKPNKTDARTAYRYFEKAQSYQANFPRIEQRLLEAREKGSIVVGVGAIPVNSVGLEVNSRFFQQKLIERLNRLNYFFVQFKSIKREENNPPDQIIDLRFDDYYIGQTYVKEIRETLVKDSVKVGEVKDSLGKRLAVYGKVEADLTRFEKTIESGGLLNLRLVDLPSGEVIEQSKIPGTYVWINDWATYQGDKRALSKKDLKMCKNKELIPPPPQELFLAFTQPIFDQVLGRLRRHYRYLK